MCGSRTINLGTSPFKWLCFIPAEPVLNVTIRANVSETVELNSTVVLTCSAPSFNFTELSCTTPIMADNTLVVIKKVRLHDCLSGLNSLWFLHWSWIINPTDISLIQSLSFHCCSGGHIQCADHHWYSSPPSTSLSSLSTAPVFVAPNNDRYTHIHSNPCYWAKMIPDRCSISRSWLNSMISA